MTITVNRQGSLRQATFSGCLTRPEIVLAGLLVLIVVVCIALSVVKSQAVHWAGFGLGLIPTFGLFAAGIYIRRFKNQPRIAQLAIANSLFLGFMAITALLIYLRFPIAELTLDKWLIRTDAAIGYSWPEFVGNVAAYPEIGYLLRFVYLSSLPQLFVMVTYLALSGKCSTLDRALMAGALSLLFTTMIWWIAPSVGPSAFTDLSHGLESKIELVTNSNYAEILRNLSAQGLAVIRPSDIVGTIAFPSYHTVMSLLVVWYLRRTALFFPALVINILMIPAILSHGGHHLLDVAGGVATFALAAWLASFPIMLRGKS